jgi:hypothetical protein
LAAAASDDLGDVDLVGLALVEQATGEVTDHVDVLVLDAALMMRAVWDSRSTGEEVMHRGHDEVQAAEDIVREIERPVLEDVDLAAREHAHAILPRALSAAMSASCFSSRASSSPPAWKLDFEWSEIPRYSQPWASAAAAICSSV